MPFWLHFYLGSFSYTSHTCFNFLWGISYTSHVGFFFLFFLYSGEFFLHIPCWLHFYAGSFANSFRTGFISIWGVSLTHPTLALISCGKFLTHPMLAFLHFYCGEFFLHILCWLHFYAGSFADSSRTGFISIWGVSLTHPMLALFFVGGGGGGMGAVGWGRGGSYTGEFLLHIPCWLLFLFF